MSIEVDTILPKILDYNKIIKEQNQMQNLIVEKYNDLVKQYENEYCANCHYNVKNCSLLPVTTSGELYPYYTVNTKQEISL